MSNEAPEPLAVRPKQAAALLNISPRSLWSLTNQGKIPHIKLGKIVLYLPEELRRFLAEQAGKGGCR